MKKILIVTGVIGVLILMAFSSIGYLRYRYDFYRFPDNSLLPLVSAGDLIAIDRKKGKWEISRHDLVVFWHEATGGHFLFKQVVGLPNESIITYDSGWCSIKDDKFYMPMSSMGTRWFDGKGTVIKIQDNAYFLIGDSKMEGFDSRNFGPVSQNQIIGKVVFTVWPLTHWRFHERAG